MRVVVSIEERFDRTPDGAVWTVGGHAYPFWQNYLHVFDRVRILARAHAVYHAPASGQRVDGPAVEVWSVPYYIGPVQYLRRRSAVAHAVASAVNDTDATILRAPSLLATLLADRLDRRGRPYAVELVGDPHDLFAPGAIRHPLRPLLRRSFTAAVLRQCRSAVGVAYTTEGRLQARYPAAGSAVTAVYSSACLDAGAFRREPRTRPAVSGSGVSGPAVLVSVGSLEQPYKGIDTLIHAVAVLATTDRPVRLVHVGAGRYLPRLHHLATRLGIADRITFTGNLPSGDAVRDHLDTGDLFVMPSRTEGLPRALIEAMARALPAIATDVGGIPELLPPQDLVPPDNPTALATAIHHMLTDPARMSTTSARNLTRAHDYSTTALTPHRNAYYHAVREATEQHTPATTPAVAATRRGSGGR